MVALAAMVHARLDRQNEKFLARLKRVEEKRLRDELLAAGGGELQQDGLSLVQEAPDDVDVGLGLGPDGGNSGTLLDASADGDDEQGVVTAHRDPDTDDPSSVKGGAARAVTFAAAVAEEGVVAPPLPPMDVAQSRTSTPAISVTSRKPAQSADLKKKIASIRRYVHIASECRVLRQPSSRLHRNTPPHTPAFALL